MMNRYMYFFRLPMQLTSVFRIAGRDDENEVLRDGDGRYVLPGTSIAGAVKSFWQTEFPGVCSRLLGDEENDSSTFFYDAVCENVRYEKRVGVKIDGRYGVVKAGQLYKQYFIGQGMTCSLLLQFSVSESDLDIALKMVRSLVAAINVGRVRFGAKKVNGAGVFEVHNATYRLLNLHEAANRREYLETDILEQFNRCTTALGSEKSFGKAAEAEWMSYRMTVSIPNALLVRSGEKESGTGSAALNMSKTFDGEDRYFIPATTIKGLIRAQALRIAQVFGIGEETIQKIFGHDSESDSEPLAGAVFAEDCLIDKAKETVYHRLMIDRLTGAGVNGALVNEKVLSTGTDSNTVIRVSIDRERLNSRECGDRLWKLANAFVFLTLRDIGAGRLAIGSGESIGYGYVEASVLALNDLECRFDVKAQTIDAGDSEPMIREWLSELEVTDEKN